MAVTGTRADAPCRFSFAANLAIITGSFCALVLFSWPIFLSFDLWILGDRISFLHLDDLFTRHLRLGVDVFYTYGLLPVLLQHLVFLPFGRGFKPMMGCTLLVLVVSAIFWAALLENLPQQRRWLIAVAALSELILIVNPNWPYSLAVLSILFALLFVLRERLEVALACSAAGCFCVPSLSLVLTALLALLIVAKWWVNPGRKFGQLAALLAPGVLVYAGLAALLASVFGFASLVATALPLAGARFYKEIGYSGFDAFLTFLFPRGYDIKYYIAYYIGSPVTWFVLCTLFLFALAIFRLARLMRGQPLDPPSTYVVLFSILQFIFIFFAYGSRGQHVIYECVLASATLVGISTLPQPRLRNIALSVFLVVGILGETGTAFKTITAWRTTRPSPVTLGLYADPALAKELAQVIDASQNHNTLMLAYATGIHNYYPTLNDPDAWFLQKGQLFPWQKQAIADQIQHSDLVVESLITPSAAVNSDPVIQSELGAMDRIDHMIYFRIREHTAVH